MQGIESFIDALSLYVTNNVLVVVFLIAAIYILKKSSQKQRKYFVAVAVISILLVFNGITFAIVKRMGEDTTYYRFFWICPIVLASAYLVVELLFEAAVKKMQKICLLAVFGVMLFVNYGQSFSGWTNLPSNIYQIDDDIVQLGDLIDELAGGERTILLANEYISAHIREYNANIVINPDGMIYLDAIMNGDNINYSASNLMAFMNSNRAEYIAIEKEKIGTGRLFENIGCECVGETDRFNLYVCNYELLEEEDDLFSYWAEKEKLYINSEYITIPSVREQKDYLYVTDMWVNTSKEMKQVIIEVANELQVEALIINSATKNSNITNEYLEEELADLEVPYVYLSQGIQYLEQSEFLVACIAMRDNWTKQSQELRLHLSEEKPMILVTDKRLYIDDTNELVQMLLAEDSPVVEVITTGGLYKEMLNDNIMQYCTRNVTVDGMRDFVTLLRVKGLETE